MSSGRISALSRRNSLDWSSGEKDVLEATKFLTGTGEKEPYGVLTGAEEVVETATEKAFAVADVYALQEGLGDAYTMNAKWVAHRNIYHKISQFEGEGGPLWQTWNSLQAGAGTPSSGQVPRLLLEYPAYRSSAMEKAVTQNKYIALYGCFQSVLHDCRPYRDARQAR